MKRRNATSRILAFLFCIAVISTGMYATNMSIFSCFSCTHTEYALSSITRFGNRIDATEEQLGNVTNEVTEDLSFVSTNKLSSQFHFIKFLFSKAVLPFIPLIIWSMLIILLQNELIDRMYLILFIHDSDGKKRGVSSFMA